MTFVFMQCLLLFIALSLAGLTWAQDRQCATPGTCTASRKCGSYRLTFYSNKVVEVYIGGVEVGQMVKGGVSTVEVAEDENSCEDILIVIDNNIWSGPVGVAAILEADDDVYATSQFIKGNSTDENGEWGLRFVQIKYYEQGDVKPLFAIATNNDFDPTKPIDYTKWTHTGIVDSVLKEDYDTFTLFREHGAFPLHWIDGPQKTGMYGFKLCNPLGHQPADTQTVVSSCFGY